MTAIIGSGGIRHKGIHVEASAFPWNLEASILIDKVGSAMSIDTTSDATAKLAGDGERILGKLVTFEDRVAEGVKVGTIEHQGGFEFDTVGVVAIGDSIIGSATAGKVRTALAPTAAYVEGEAGETASSRGNLVTAVDAGNSTCQVLFF